MKINQNEKRKQLAEYLARHIKNSHHQIQLPPSQAELTDYIVGGIAAYESEHINQRVVIGLRGDTI